MRNNETLFRMYIMNSLLFKELKDSFQSYQNEVSSQLESLGHESPESSGHEMSPG